MYKNGHNFATALPIDVMFGSSMRFSGSADFMVQLSVTLSDPEPQFQGHSLKANISQTVHSIHSMSRQGFSGSADRMALFPVR